ncbi:hypothetical protein PMAYCL1PPCAC_08768 [Pristionchus mayeri]|uniref:Uncharacterized protein n=1 Tax=Pristionchus mayeri TaxID=1317129 RepID=A0AAN4ZCD5_9BILA|nr:hypothetical protein PMAYCL1PPCAC_08768 [Pristionchus mayeri]
MFPLLPYTHIHTVEQLPLYRDDQRTSKIDLIIRRNCNRHRLVFLDFLAADCFSGTHYRLKLDENTYINLPEDSDTPPPITLTDFYRELRDFVSGHEEIVAELTDDEDFVIVKLFPSAPLLFLSRLDDNQMIEVIEEASSEDKRIESMQRDLFRARWTRLAAQILHASPKGAITRRAEEKQVNYISALRYGLHKSPAATVIRPSRVSRRRSVSATR